MKLIIRLILCLLFLSTFSCKKENPVINDPKPTKENPKQCRIISGPNFSYNGIIKFTYNEDSTIRLINAHEGPYEYYYENRKLKRVQLKASLYPIDSFETDQTGKIISRYLYDYYDDDESQVNVYNVAYIYNSQNKIIKANYELPRYYDGTIILHSIVYGVYYYTYNEKGNIIKEIDSVKNDDGSSRLAYSAVYEYDDMKNPFYLMDLYALRRNSNLVTMSPNNITRKQEFHENGNEIISTYSYTYSLDGYPNEVKLFNPQINDSARYQYTYECW